MLIRVGLNPHVRPLAQTYGQVLRGWSHLVRIVPLDYLHVTLAWLPAPVAAQIPPEQSSGLVTALTQRLSAIPAFTVVVGPAVISPHGVRLELTPGDGLAGLGTHTRDALRCVFDADAISDPTTHDQHIALAYGTHNAPSDALAADLLTTPTPSPQHRPCRATLNVTDVTVTDADTFAPDPWHWRRTSQIRLHQKLSDRQSRPRPGLNKLE